MDSAVRAGQASKAPIGPWSGRSETLAAWSRCDIARIQCLVSSSRWTKRTISRFIVSERSSVMNLPTQVKS